MKASDPVIIDLRGLVSYADYSVVVTAANPRLVRSISDNLVKVALENGNHAKGVEGLDGARWVLIDLGDVIVHVFHEPMRAFYDLDGLWSDAPRLELEDAPAASPTPPAFQGP